MCDYAQVGLGSIPCIDVVRICVRIFILSVICICGIADQSNGAICSRYVYMFLFSTRLQHCYTYHFLFCIFYLFHMRMHVGGGGGGMMSPYGNGTKQPHVGGGGHDVPQWDDGGA